MVGSGMIGVGAGGSVGGTDVGGTDVLVDATTVLVGMIRVEVGRKTGGVVVAVAAIGVSTGSRVRRTVAVSAGRVGVGVMVALGVKLGVAEMRGVAVRVEEAVAVGTVEVGNGPSKELAVSARAVLVFLATTKIFACLVGLLKVNQSHRIAPRNKRIMTRARRSM